MAQQESKPYTGPSVDEMIANHTLGDNIIKYHDSTGNEILDQHNLRTLSRFVNHPEDRGEILKDAGISDSQDSKEFRGNLADYVVLKHKYTPVLRDDEMVKLKEWFNSGAVEEVLDR